MKTIFKSFSLQWHWSWSERQNIHF